MLIDAVRWNMLNVIRVEFFFDCYRLWNIIINSSIQSQRGQYAIVSLVITLIAHLSVQFNFTWILTVYSAYLALGAAIWLHRRVYFYHRRRDTTSINTDINAVDNIAAVTNIINLKHSHNTGTLRHDKNSHSNQAASSSSSSSASSSASATPTNSCNGLSHNENTNSLQRQRAMAYRDFQRTLNEPRLNPRVFALSLSHLSQISKLVADEGVFDEMHFQILATRRDVVNVVLRFLIICAGTILSYN